MVKVQFQAFVTLTGPMTSNSTVLSVLAGPMSSLRWHATLHYVGFHKLWLLFKPWRLETSGKLICTRLLEFTKINSTAQSSPQQYTGEGVSFMLSPFYSLHPLKEDRVDPTQSGCCGEKINLFQLLGMMEQLLSCTAHCLSLYWLSTTYQARTQKPGEIKGLDIYFNIGRDFFEAISKKWGPT